MTQLNLPNEPNPISEHSNPAAVEQVSTLAEPAIEPASPEASPAPSPEPEAVAAPETEQEPPSPEPQSAALPASPRPGAALLALVGMPDADFVDVDFYEVRRRLRAMGIEP